METAVTIAIIGLIVPLLATVIGTLTIREQRKKLQAEAETLHKQAATAAKQSDMDCAMQLINQLQEDNDRLRTHQKQRDDDYERIYAKLRELQNEYEHLKAGVNILINQIRGAGMKPAWEPVTGSLKERV